MNFLNILVYSLIAGLATVFGTYLIFRNEPFARRNSVSIISFTTGVMLSISFLHLLPEAKELYSDVWKIAFVGFVVFYILQEMIKFHPCHEEECEVHHLGLISFIGLAFHSFLDGVAISVGFETSKSIGILTTIAILLHEVPEGITITGVLLHFNLDRKKIWLYSLIVALATPIGAIISYFFLKNISKEILGAMLSFTAGSFIYIAAADLLPQTHKSHHKVNFIYFLCGITCVLLLGVLNL